MSDINRIKERINFCIKGELWEQIPKFFEELHPADIAEIINHASGSVHTKLFELIEDEIKPDVLAELDDQTEADILEDLSDEEISDIVEEMAPDDAADVLGELEERSKEILDLMESEDSEEVRELLQYHEDTAGGIMTPDFVAASANMTAGESIDYIGSLDLDEPFYYLYVVDAEGRLTGWIQLWELLKQANRNQTLDVLADKETISVHTDADQEEVARLATKYDLSSLPVLDWQNKLVGRITMDDIMDVIEEEASEDIFKLAGSDDSELDYSSPLHAVKTRLPWLMITLFAGFVSSVILKRFIDHHIVALSFFVPIIMAMGGNTGIQSSTLIIRGLAVGSFSDQELFKLLGRELATGALMGLICGMIIGVWSHFMVGSSSEIPAIFLAFTVGVSLFSAMMFAAVFGAFAPLLLNRANADPAVASGPFVTASIDILALLIYYGVTVTLIALRSNLLGG
ncbi:Magnesium transporter MgtE [Pontiella desulfatans]|uniref:Magnesium transporter MgtE n=1 Tax=Pontiella desulfatans TaxID=2750659 RepID=A0A6C2TX81_PONDE|nr:magnesium transporter [Pontiella desulfatans]VGO12285.1 Magnesium transporter MgtE [Pontiella desulfatans]